MQRLPALDGRPVRWGVRGITASDDQIIAGLSMWIGGALIYLALLTVFFFHWLHDDEFASSQDTRPSIS